MRHIRARRQRQEVRKILHAMKLELAAQGLSQEITGHGSVVSLGEVINKSKSIAIS